MGAVPNCHTGEEMIQDIYPSKLYNEFRKCEIEEKDYLLVFDENGKVLVKEDIILQPNNLSLTNEMMRMFKEGKDGNL